MARTSFSIVIGVEITNILVKKAERLMPHEERWKYITYIPCALGAEDFTSEGDKIQPLSQEVILEQGKEVWACFHSWYKLDGVSSSLSWVRNAGSCLFTG